MSKTMCKVGLAGVKFNAAIGYFPEERILKNNFLVDLQVLFNQAEDQDTDDLSQTVNYTSLYDICATEFKQETLLIETVAQAILNAVKRDFPLVSEIAICIKKLNPPIKAEIAYSFIELNYKK